ncbi:MAG: DegT/DnrJ/EryC1/StrS family aminotransferase [Bryobacteraceae bacterium]
MSDPVTRRKFVAAGAIVSAASAATMEKPALLGGKPIRSRPFPSWPQTSENDEKAWIEVLRSGKWNKFNGAQAKRFEQTWATLTGAKHCLAVSSGTAALMCALNALDVGPGDEVIVPTYTFVATINAVFLQYALPVFVDTDPDTFQIDARKIEAAITPRTKAILPAHIGGAAADMDLIGAIARKHKLPVIEDACQAHMAEWRGRKLSSLGDLGCFSFQASKNLNSGEGGALLTSSDDLYSRAASFHNNGRSSAGSFVRNGCNLRMTEFQAVLLLEQLTRVEAQSQRREQNAVYLAGLLRDIQGIRPASIAEGCTRNAYHLFLMRYDSAGFAGLPRARFLKALAAEGVPCSGGYTPLNQDLVVENTLKSRAYQRIFTAAEIASYRERNRCPVNDKLCGEALWFTQTVLLGEKSDMDQIAAAVRKIQTHARALAASAS